MDILLSLSMTVHFPIQAYPPNSVTSIKSLAFAACHNLSNIALSEAIQFLIPLIITTKTIEITMYYISKYLITTKKQSLFQAVLPPLACYT